MSSFNPNYLLIGPSSNSVMFGGHNSVRSMMMIMEVSYLLEASADTTPEGRGRSNSLLLKGGGLH